MWILILLLALLTAAAWRWKGDGEVDRHTPGAIRAGLTAVIVCLPLLWMLHWAVALIFMTLTALLMKRGHGNWADYGRREPDTTEWLEPLVRRLTGAGNGVWHDAVGMMLSGAVTLAPLAMAAAGGMHDALWLALIPAGGLVKAAAYWLGWALYSLAYEGRPNPGGPMARLGGLLEPFLGLGTPLAEALTGLGWGALSGLLLVSVWAG